MTPAPWHELGDPMFEQLAAEEQADYARAQARGLRVQALTEAIVSGLSARGVLPGAVLDAARVITYGIVADYECGCLAVDIPDLRKDEFQKGPTPMRTEWGENTGPEVIRGVGPSRDRREEDA